MPFRELNINQAQSPQVSQQPSGNSFRELNVAGLNQKFSVPQEKRSFFGRITDKLKERQSKVSESLNLKQGGASKTLQVIGQGAGFFGDVVGEALIGTAKTLAPNFVEEGVRNGTKAVLDTPLGQQALNTLNKGVEDYRKWREENQEFARNFEAALNIGDAALSVLGVGATKKVVQEGAKKAAKKALEVGGEKMATKLDDAAKALVDKTLKLNPSDIQRIERPSVAGKSPSEWLLEKGIRGDQKEIVGKLDELAISSRSQLDEGLNKITQTYNVAEGGEAESVGKVLDVVQRTFSDIPGNEDIAKFVSDLKGKGTLTLSDINSVKRLIDREINVFKVTGDVKGGATARGLENLRSDIQKFIESEATRFGFEDVAKLNKDVQVSRQISKAVDKTLDRTSSNRSMGLTDWIALGGGATGGGFVFGNPIVGALATLGVKKIAENPRLRMALADKLASLSDDVLKKLDTAALAGNQTKIKDILLPIITALKEEFPDLVEDQVVSPDKAAE